MYQGYTPLHFAAYGKKEIVELLIKSGANVHALNGDVCFSQNLLDLSYHFMRSRVQLPFVNHITMYYALV